MTNQPIDIETRIIDGKVCQIHIYPPAEDYPDVNAYMWAMNPSSAIHSYMRITGCTIQTAIISVRLACQGIPGYCRLCGKKDTARFPDGCPNEVHDAANRTLDHFSGSIR